MTFSFDDGVRQLRLGELTAEAAAERLIAQLTDKELLWLLDGDTPVRALPSMVKKISLMALSGGALPRLGIPGIRFSDGPRGVVIGDSTAFPVTIARAATWKPDLEERVGHAIGVETRAAGANYSARSASTCCGIRPGARAGVLRRGPGPDRSDGGGLTRGLRRNVMACVKHFALNSMENARFTVDVTVDDHALHEVYLPHFKTVVEAGADSVMSSYNPSTVTPRRQRDPAHRRPARRVGLRRIRHQRLGVRHPRCGQEPGGGHGRGDAVAAAAGPGTAGGLRARSVGSRNGADVGATHPDHHPAALRHSRRRRATSIGHRLGGAPGTRPSRSRTGSILLKNEPVDGAAVLPLAPTIRRSR